MCLGPVPKGPWEGTGIPSAMEATQIMHTLGRCWGWGTKCWAHGGRVPKCVHSLDLRLNLQPKCHGLDQPHVTWGLGREAHSQPPGP